MDVKEKIMVRAFGKVFAGESLPPMHTPSLESLVPSMTSIKAACDLGHSTQKTCKSWD